MTQTQSKQGSATASRKILRVWTDSITVGIYDNSWWTVRLYVDRAVVTMPTVKWRGNTGGYHEDKYRIVGKTLDQLLALAKTELDDGEDYTDRAYELIYKDLYHRGY